SKSRGLTSTQLPARAFSDDSSESSRKREHAWSSSETVSLAASRAVSSRRGSALATTASPPSAGKLVLDGEGAIDVHRAQEPPDVACLATAARLEASECPGATDATSAANPADSAPAPAITQRRVHDTRRSAASRSSWAGEGALRLEARSGDGVMLDNISTRASDFSKASVRIRLLCRRRQPPR